MMLKKSQLLLGLPVVLFAGFANAAATAPSALSVTASVQSNCRISSTGAVAFTNYDPTSLTDNSANGQINFKCTKGTNANVTLDKGGNATGGPPATQRFLKSGANTIPYQLYQPAATGGAAACTTTDWGDTGFGATYSAAAFNIASVSTGTTDTVLKVCGVITAGSADVPAGAGYTDSVNVIVNF